MDSIAERLQVSKAEILDPNSDNMAVRMALAETHVIADTKGYLMDHGIDLETFSRKERSDNVILVKNLEHAITEAELRDMFGKHGDLGRVSPLPLLPSRDILNINLETLLQRTHWSHDPLVLSSL